MVCLILLIPVATIIAMEMVLAGHQLAAVFVDVGVSNCGWR